MSESDQLLAAVQEIRDLVRLMAEPAIAERDQKLRAELKRIVGNSAQKSKAVLVMDGSRTQRDIQRETGINQGHLSTLVKQLKENKLLSGDPKNPRLAITIPTNFFETS
jgi:DNA-binding MarR family transcriptional regulator